jgi:hypothetical protein
LFDITVRNIYFYSVFVREVGNRLQSISNNYQFLMFRFFFL